MHSVSVASRRVATQRNAAHSFFEQKPIEYSCVQYSTVQCTRTALQPNRAEQSSEYVASYSDAAEVELLERPAEGSRVVARGSRGRLELLPRAAVVRAEFVQHESDCPDGVVGVRVIRVLV